jgi:hypothetical protein
VTAKSGSTIGFGHVERCGFGTNVGSIAYLEALKSHRGEHMKLTTALAVSMGIAALAACNKSPQENQADQIETNAENTADIIESNTENVADTLEANGQNAADAVREAGDNTADQVRAAGENRADAVRNSSDADGNSAH